MLRFPQPTRAAVPCPSFASGLVHPLVVETPAGIGFHIVHDPFRSNLRFHYQVDVIGADMRRQQLPLLLEAPLLQGVQDHVPAAPIQPIWWLVHVLPFRPLEGRIGSQQTVSRQVVVPMHGTCWISVQVAAIAGKCNQIGQPTASVRPDRSLWSRLRKAYCTLGLLSFNPIISARKKAAPRIFSEARLSVIGRGWFSSPSRGRAGRRDRLPVSFPESPLSWLPWSASAMQWRKRFAAPCGSPWSGR